MNTFKVFEFKFEIIVEMFIHSVDGLKAQQNELIICVTIEARGYRVLRAVNSLNIQRINEIWWQ